MESCRSSTTPVVGFIDVDSFECQLWQKEFPQTRNKPCVVANHCGRIVAVTHEAKNLGISRSSTPHVRNAVALCPELIIFSKEVRYGKPETKRTRTGTSELYSSIVNFFKIVQMDGVVIELASSDELYIDLTIGVSGIFEQRKMNAAPPHMKESIKIPNKVIFEDKRKSFIGPMQYGLKKESFHKNYRSYVQDEKVRLILGGQILNRLCEHIENKTQLVCSGGVSSNKLLSKLCCGLNKPNKITVLYDEGLPRVAQLIKISSIPGLGSKTGASLCEHFKIATMSELRGINIRDLCLFCNNQKGDETSDEFGLTTEQSFGEVVYSWARGKDKRPIVHKYLRDSMRLNKPSPTIVKYDSLLRVLRDLCYELDENLEEEKKVNGRVGASIKFDISFNSSKNDKKAIKLSNTFTIMSGSYENREKLFKIVLQKLVVDAPKFNRNDFKVTELTAAVKEFIPINSRSEENIFAQLGSLTIATPRNPTLNVFVKYPRNLSIKNHVYLGSFFTQDNAFTSLNLIKNPPTTNGPSIPKLLSISELQKIIGMNLGEGYYTNFETITDHLSYLELKHHCFLSWLLGSDYVAKIKEGVKKVPHFIGFSGRFSDPMKSPSAVQNGDWEIYGINIGGVVYLWDEKKPIWTDSDSYYGLNFEYNATQYSGPNTIEFNKSYVMSEWELGEHRCLSVSEIDGVDESNEWVELACWKENKNPHVKIQKLKKMWAQSAVGGVNKFVIGTRSYDGTLLSIEHKTMAQLEAELGKVVVNCLDFENRFLAFIKLNLPVSDENVVKKFSFVCGDQNVICSDVPKSVHERLFVPVIYKEKVLSLFN